MPNYEDKIKKPKLTLDDYKLAVESAGQRYSDLAAKPFEYDINKDELYQQMAERYRQQGNLAMRDTMGQAAAMTGGYGNSYAQTAGQQVYNSYMNELNDRSFDLYDAAVSKYTAEREAAKDEYSVALERYLTEYNIDANEKDRALNNAKLFLESGGKLGYDNGTMTSEQVKEMQTALGLTPTGERGRGSYEASNNLTADKAWKAHQAGTLGKTGIIPPGISETLALYLDDPDVKVEDIKGWLEEQLIAKTIDQEAYNQLIEYVDSWIDYNKSLEDVLGETK